MEQAFKCALVAADEDGNPLATTPVIIPATLLPLYLSALLPIAIEKDCALGVSR